MRHSERYVTGNGFEASHAVAATPLDLKRNRVGMVDYN